MTERNTSALLAGSLSWDNDAIKSLRPAQARARIAQESMRWQQASQEGADAEMDAASFPWRRVRTRNGVSKTVPRRPPRPAHEANRLVELHGLMGAIGEQLGLAWTAEQDVQRLIATKASRGPEHQRVVQRALSESAGHFTLGAAHSFGNLTLRLMLFNPSATAVLSSEFKKAQGFPPGSDDRDAWVTLNRRLTEALQSAAEVSGNRFMSQAALGLSEFQSGDAFQALNLRRGMDYHRRRPQSLSHASPRAGTVSITGSYTRRVMVGSSLEPEADADQVHSVVANAMATLRVAMRTFRVTMPKAIRAEGVAYVSAL